MSVTTRTLEDLATRVPEATRTPQLELPIGWEPRDWEHIRRDTRGNTLFERTDGHLHVCAVGTQLPTAGDGLRAFLTALSSVAANPEVRSRLRVWFVGTSNQRRHDAAAAVLDAAAAAGLSDMVFEHPPRLTYFDALRVLRDAHVVLVLGSGEPHYTPSRVFPAIASRRPVIARLHRESPAYRLLASAGRSRHVSLIAYSDDTAGQADAFASALRGVLERPHVVEAPDDDVLAPFTGDALARQLAGFLDQVCPR
jgi:hypothetical protein